MTGPGVSPVPRRRSRAQRGSAMVEVFWLGMLLLLPLVYLVLSVFAVQSAAYGVTQAAREAGRLYTATGDRATAAAAARVALDDQGVTSPASVVICGGSDCYAPGAAVEVVVTTTVPLPFVPDPVASALRTSVTVTGRHVATVDAYREL